MSTTNSNAGVEMMKVRVLSHVVGGITTSVRVSVKHVQNIAAVFAAGLCPIPPVPEPPQAIFR
jgi:hypothetical protein